LVQETQTELESLQRTLETAPPAKRRHLQIQTAELQSELGLFQARQQALHNMLNFASGASGFDFPLCKLQTLWAGDAEEREQPVASRWIVPRDNQEIGTGLLHDFR
jgi:hypothetical protein